MQHSEHGSEAHPKTQQEADADQHLYCTDEVPEEYRVGQNQVGEKWLIEADCSFLNKTLQVLLEAAVCEFRLEELVLSKEKEENRRENADDRNCFWQGNSDPRHQRRSLRKRLLCVRAYERGVVGNLNNKSLAAWPIIGHILFQRIQFLA